MPAARQVKVDERTLKLTNPDKILYPATGFTKAEVLDYYSRIANWILPHLKNRPVTLKRFPDGVDGQAFYEKDAPRHTPEWVATAPVTRRASGQPIRYVTIGDRATLLWCANLATCAEVAFLLRDSLEKLGLKAWPKVSGPKGIQLYVPLNRKATYATTQPLARALADSLARDHPGLIVSEMPKKLRPGKVFIDWSQNSDFKTTIAVYSLRAKDRPYVSVPVTWEELAAHPDDLHFEPEAALRRVEQRGDLFAPVLELKQKLPILR